MRVGLTAAHGAGAPLSRWRAARRGQKRKPRSRSAALSSLGATFSGVLLNAHSSELAEPLANCTESSCEDPDEVEISCLNWLRHHVFWGGDFWGEFKVHSLNFVRIKEGARASVAGKSVVYLYYIFLFYGTWLDSVILHLPTQPTCQKHLD